MGPVQAVFRGVKHGCCVSGSLGRKGAARVGREGCHRACVGGCREVKGALSCITIYHLWGCHRDSARG